MAHSIYSQMALLLQATAPEEMKHCPTTSLPFLFANQPFAALG
jgi:hypothetical protein